MRLNPLEKQDILTVILSLDAEATVYLFGSRTDDFKQGGDIDLLVISQILTWDHKRLIRNGICDKIGEQKIDILISKDEATPFVIKAIKTGIKLNE